jgi:hypothetical protein
MDTETATNPVEAEDNPLAESDAEQEVETNEPQLDDDGNPIPEPDDDEEIDLDDVKLRVPKTAAEKIKALKDGALMQADYTRKTQELADGRKAFDAERQNFQQASTAELATAGQIMVYDQQLAQYARIDWQQWQYDDPDAAQSAFMAYQQLKDAKNNALGHLNQLKTQRTSAAQQEAAKRIEQTKAAIAKDIPDWSPAVEAQVADFGMKAFGFTADEMADMKIDPRIAKAFHRLHTLEEAEGKRSKAARIAQGQEVTPVQTLRGTSGKAPVSAATRNFADFERLAAKSKT